MTVRTEHDCRAGCTVRRYRRGLLLVGLVSWLILSGVACSVLTKSGPSAGAKTKTFVSQNFFAMNLPTDWVARDLTDGANLFYSEELIFVRIKILEPPESMSVSDFVSEKIKADAEMQGGDATLLKIGYKGVNPYSNYLITKPNGQRLQEFLLYNDDLKLLFVMMGASRPEDFDEFSRLFESMFESFQFRFTARLPLADGSPFQPDFTGMAGTWVAYLEGVRTENYTLLQQSCAGVNSSKIINDANVREVKQQYFPYLSSLYTFVSHIEIRDQFATATIALRALPPEGFLMHESREFIMENGRWRLLRFEKVD